MRLAMVLALTASLLVVGCASPKGMTAADKRQYATDMRDATMDNFFAKYIGLENKVRQSPGFAVMSNIGTAIIFVTTDGGYGVVTDNRTGDATFMKVGGLGLGLGIGVEDTRTLLVFRSDSAMQQFIRNGWDFMGEVSAAAKAGDTGGAWTTAGSANKDIDVYEMTLNGLALQANGSAEYYWKYEALNAVPGPRPTPAPAQ
jgi:lipid-binding SYLF domain-containing protein